VIVVVDASVAVKWFAEGQWALTEDHRDRAIDLLLAARNGDADFLQPPHFLAEVAAVLARNKPEGALEDLRDLMDMDIRFTDVSTGYATAVELAVRLRHHLFDTLYHALALETPGATLITADRRYYDKAQHLGHILWLAEFPQELRGSGPA